MKAAYPSATVNERFVTVGTRRIFLAESGTGPTVLMLHEGSPGASGLSNYSRNIGMLAARYRVLVPDLPGYGQSSKGIDVRDPFGDLAASMLAMLRAIRISRAHVVGNSFGGACALRMAIESPETIGRLVLMGADGVNTSRALPTMALRRSIGYYKGRGPSREKLATLLRRDFVDDASSVTEDLVDERFRASLGPEVLAKPSLRRLRGITNFRHIDFTRDPRVRAVENPTLVLWGMEDKVNRVSGAKALATRLPNCDVHLYGKTGHWVQWERAEEVNAAVASFLAQDVSVGTVE
ncbi:alpha/beta fold hydrolase [Paraburkholderia sp. J63]|uniref:alpha/beta fold hydrolase n=1 Tax=Paraburkholderia sp. J63 TaxID=2805434 RepID=UPI002ABDCB53|nr:alpha/beta fold hydrolase [Paraburkholderia sp. J63]